MLLWLQRKIIFLESIKDRWLFTAIFFCFGVLFVNLFEPFTLYQWSDYNTKRKILLVSSHILPFCGVFFVTQFVLRPLLKITQFNLLKLSLWIIGEILLITSINISIFASPALIFSSVFIEAFYHSTLVLLICYFFSLSILNAITKTSFFLKESKSTLVNIRNYKNKIKLSVDHNAILFVKSTENYIQLYYKRNNDIKNILIRNTLKTIESELKEYEILRSQRSYLVNKNHITSIEKIKNKRIIHLSKTELSIPLSQSFVENFQDIIK